MKWSCKRKGKHEQSNTAIISVPHHLLHSSIDACFPRVQYTQGLWLQKLTALSLTYCSFYQRKHNYIFWDLVMPHINPYSIPAMDCYSNDGPSVITDACQQRQSPARAKRLAINHATLKQRKSRIFQTVSRVRIIWNSETKPKGILWEHKYKKHITKNRPDIEFTYCF